MSELTSQLAVTSELAAPRLLGSLLVREIDGQDIVGQIVETESYDQSDVASHSYKGESARNQVMFGPAGHLYVYFTYGMHYCCNVVVGPKGQGAAVLIRAIEPLEGIEVIKRLRAGRSDRQLTNGPAKVCQALAINRDLNGHDLSRSPLRLVLREPLKTKEIVQTTRIGISRAQDMPWRFYLKGNAYVSKL